MNIRRMEVPSLADFTHVGMYKVEVLLGTYAVALSTHSH